MPKLDAHHQIVKRALVRNGWTITHDSLTIKYKGFRWIVDLGAEKGLAAEKSGRKIAVEVKVFGGKSFASDLEKALGQYGIYRTLLKKTDPGRELFMALEQEVWHDYFRRPAIEEIIADQQVHLPVFNAGTEEVIQWIKQTN